MTGLETYMQNNGWTLTQGSTKEWNTYDNCNRSYQHISGKRLLIGLLAKPTRVGGILPMVYREGELIEALPVDDYDKFLDMYL